MEWQYNNEWFTSKKVDWSKFNIPFDRWNEIEPNAVGKYYNLGKHTFHDPLVYVPKWHKCYYIERFGVFGRGNQLKFCLKDPYTKQVLYTMAKDVELVINITPDDELWKLIDEKTDGKLVNLSS